MNPHNVAASLLTPANIAMLRQCLEAESCKDYPLSALRGFIVGPDPTPYRELLGGENNGCPFIGIVRQEDFLAFLKCVNTPPDLQTQLIETTKENALRVLIIDEPIVLCCDVPIQFILTARPYSYVGLCQRTAEEVLSTSCPTLKNLTNQPTASKGHVLDET